jgi:hypothetical protein
MFLLREHQVVDDAKMDKTSSDEKLSDNVIDK